jgi:hypothetical protein
MSINLETCVDGCFTSFPIRETPVGREKLQEQGQGRSRSRGRAGAGAGAGAGQGQEQEQQQEQARTRSDSTLYGLEDILNTRSETW